MNALQAIIDNETIGNKQVWIGLNDIETKTTWLGYWGNKSAGAPFFTWPNLSRNTNAPYGEYDVQFHAWNNINVPKVNNARRCAYQIAQQNNANSIADGKWNTKNCNKYLPYACYGIDASVLVSKLATSDTVVPFFQPPSSSVSNKPALSTSSTFQPTTSRYFDTPAPLPNTEFATKRAKPANSSAPLLSSASQGYSVHLVHDALKRDLLSFRPHW